LERELAAHFQWRRGWGRSICWPCRRWGGQLLWRVGVPRRYSSQFNRKRRDFELSPSSGGWTEHTIHVFTGGPDDAYPFGTLILDFAGNLYGTTSYGGDPSCNCGVAFEFTPTSTGWKEIILHTFTGPDGERPVANLIFDSSGNLYGTTEFSATGAGVVFKLTPGAGGAWTETVLYQFTNWADGGIPVSGVIFDTAGNLYGTASNGGNSSNCGYSGCGVVYKLSPRPVGAWRETVLHSFDYLDGAYPQAALLFDAAGNLYSTAYDGSRSRCGVVFELSPRSGGGWMDSTTYAFTCGDDGANPHSGLVIDGAGNLYGTTQFGGVNNRGAVYETTP